MISFLKKFLLGSPAAPPAVSLLTTQTAVQPILRHQGANISARDHQAVKVAAKNTKATNQRTSISVHDHQGVEKILGSELARGGEGVVYRLVQRHDVLVKIYHPAVLSNAGNIQRLQNKIMAMAANNRLRGLDRVAWPLLPLFNSANGNWCGYAMGRRNGISLQGLLGAPQNLLEFAPGWNRLHLVRLCLDFLDTIDTLCTERAVPVDFNPCNFLVDIEKQRFHFIDCDGYQFQDAAGRLYLTEAVRPDLAPPELLARTRWDESPVAPASLRFSVGMVLFFILNLGNNPYRHRNGNDPIENLRAGLCGLGRGADCELPRGPWYVIWSHLIFDLKQLFIRCFRDGHRNPVARPAIAEWRAALLKYEDCLVRGFSDAALIPAQAKDQNFRGTGNPKSSTRNAA